MSVLEIGCSSGYFLEHLLKWKPSLHITGADIIEQPLYRLADRMAQKDRPIPLLRFDIGSCPLYSASQDIVVALNVLEHIEDDEKAIKEIHRILKPGGAFIFEVPAGPSLYDKYDAELHHYRRYRSSELEKILIENGFSKFYLTHLGIFMYPPFYIIKKLRSCYYNFLSKKQKNQIDSESTSAKLIKVSGSSLFKTLFSFELWLGNWISYPVGIRCCGIFIKI